MNTKPTMTATGRRRMPRAPKLKDTCDMCSTSKVRCSKDKPVCGRCSKLGYPCSYSPARRMGRPHPSRESSLRDKNERPVDEQPKPTIQPQYTAQPTTQSSEVHYFGNNTQTSLDHNFQGPQSSKHWQQLDVNANNDDDLNDLLLLSTPNSRRTSFPTPSQATPEVSAQVRRELDEIKLFDFDDQMDSTPASQINGLCTPASSCDGTTNMYFPPYSRPTRGSSTVSDVGLQASNSSPESALEHTQEDCTTVAINTLQQINTVRRKHFTSPTSSCGISLEALDVILNTVSPSVKRTSTIILCPCSQNTDVCLLATAVCTSILDVYDDIIANLQLPTAKIHTSAAPCATPSSYIGVDTNPSFLNDISLDVNDRTDFCTYVQQYLQATRNNDRKAATTRVLEELRKVGNLVVLFAKRYNAHNRDENPVDSLPALAVELKQRVRNMTNEVTDCLARW